MRLACLATVAALVFTAGPAPAQDTIDNPEFTSWSKFKKGTSTVVKSTTVAAGNTTEILITTTLVEVGADKLVVETATAFKVAGMEIKSASKRDVAKTIPLPKGAKKEDFTGGKPPGTTEEGTETVKIGGAEYKTKWFKYNSEAGGSKTEAKIWMSDDVPGTLIKMETTTAGAVAATTKLELIEIKKP